MTTRFRLLAPLAFALLGSTAFAQKVLTAPAPAVLPIKPAVVPAIVPTVVPTVEPMVVAPVKPLAVPAVIAPDKLAPVVTRPDLGASKLNLDTSGFKGAGSISDGKAARFGVPGGRPAQPGVLGDGSAPDFDKNLGLLGETVIKGNRHGDTFAGERINQRNRGDANDFGGGKGGQAALFPQIGGGKPGGIVTGTGSPEPIPFPASAGSDTGGGAAPSTEVPLSNGDNAGVATGVAGGKLMDNASGARTTATVVSGKAGSVIVPVETRKREQEDATGGGSGAPMGRSDVVNMQRAVAARTGGAGGADDGRADGNASGGGSGGPMRAPGTAEGAVREDMSGATVNLDAVLKINTQVNPGAR